MLFSLLLMIISAGGIAILVGKHLKEVKALSASELDTRLQSLRPLDGDLKEFVVVPLVNFWHNVFWPEVLKEFEKVTAKSRLLLLRLERNLHNLTNYIRGKRELSESRGEESAYWGEVKKGGSGNKE